MKHKHVPGLDGLRGLAVLVVVLFHLGEGICHGGYLGVDVFFVLSGYLITHLLWQEQAAHGRVDLRAFWVRRARRLLPALLLLMPAIAAYAWIWAKPEELEPLRKQALATLLYLANWHAIAQGRSYWALFAAPSPLEHTWSLAIEEQFYLLWPLFMLLVLPWRSRRRAALSMLGLALVSVACMALRFDPEDTSRAYLGTDTRAASILFGAAFATWPRPRAEVPSRLRDGLGVAALLGLGAAVLWLDGNDRALYRGGFVAVEAATLVLVACAIAARGPVARVLSWRPLRWLGTLSYGVYLWHWPIFCVLTPERTGWAPLPLSLARVTLTLVIALLSFHWVEQPIRRHGLRLPRPALASIVGFAGAALLVVVATRTRALAAVPPVETTALVADDAGALLPESGAGVDIRALPPAASLPPGTRRVLLLGDSVAEALGYVLRAQQTGSGAFVSQRGVPDCSIMEERHGLKRGQPLGHPNPEHGCAARWVADVHELRPDTTVVTVGGAYMTPMWIDGNEVYVCDAGWQEFYEARLHQLADEMGEAAGQLVLTTTAAPGPRLRSRPTLGQVDCLNSILRRVAERRRLPLIELGHHLCPQHQCQLMSDDAPIRPDGLHPAGPGAKQLALWMLDEVRRTGQLMR